MHELGELQRRIEAERATRGFTTDPSRILTLLVEEVGEIAGEIKRTWSVNYPDLDVDALSDEIADALVLLSALASAFGIDLGSAVTRKFFASDSKREWASARPGPRGPGAPGL